MVDQTFGDPSLAGNFAHGGVAETLFQKDLLGVRQTMGGSHGQAFRW